MLDGQRRVALINDGAREPLGVGDDAGGAVGGRARAAGAADRGAHAAEPRVDEVHLTAAGSWW